MNLNPLGQKYFAASPCPFAIMDTWLQQQQQLPQTQVDVIESMNFKESIASLYSVVKVNQVIGSTEEIKI